MQSASVKLTSSGLRICFEAVDFTVRFIRYVESAPRKKSIRGISNIIIKTNMVFLFWKTFCTVFPSVHIFSIIILYENTFFNCFILHFE